MVCIFIFHCVTGQAENFCGRQPDVEVLRREVLVAQRYHSVYLCENIERGQVRGRGGGGGIEGIKETLAMRNPIMLKRYRKSSIKPPGGLIYLEAYLRGGGGLNRDRGENVTVRKTFAGTDQTT